MISCDYSQVKVFARRNKLNTNQILYYIMQQQIYNVKEIKRKIGKRPKYDIRTYFKCQNKMKY